MKVAVNPSFDIEIQLSPVSHIASVDFDNLLFGKVFTDHMFEADYAGGKWQNCTIKPLSNLELHPATSALHYGQAIFEGMKAFKNQEGKARIFRPDMNWKRLNESCERMAIPEVPEELFMDAIFNLVRIEQAWIPDTDDGSMYIRPFIFATDDYVGIKPSDTFKLIIFCCPVSKYYQKPVRVYMQEEYIRAFPGGTGGVKAAGNYAATMMPLKAIREKGYDQMLWIDGVTHNRLQEIGTMNVFVQIDDTVITIPTDEGTILKGVTRASCLDLLRDAGHKVEIRDVTIQELLDAHKTGRLKDAFGTGTAATIAPIGVIGYKDVEYELPPVEDRKISNWLKHEMWAIRKGVAEDKFGWMWEV
ncbi:MAG: branched-chain amino acid aminotransferase [Chitinophagales bacterium]